MDYVGTLTADEVVLAGAIATGETKGRTNYLYLDNSQWWTLTISGIREDSGFSWQSAFAFPSNYWGKDLLSPEYYHDTQKLRPAIVLKPNVSISGQGTKSDPYVVQ